jgi:hypothetical protein
MTWPFRDEEAGVRGAFIVEGVFIGTGVRHLQPEARLRIGC